MNKFVKNVLVSVPCLHDPGGVASYFNGVVPYFPQGLVSTLEIGGKKSFGGGFHQIVDQYRFRSQIKVKQPGLIHVNPSLNFKSFIRDGLFAWQAKQMGYPLLVFWHGWNKAFANIVEKRYLPFFRKTFGRADCFIVLASEFKQTLQKWGVSVPIYRETTNVDDRLLSEFKVERKWADPVQLTKIGILFLARLEREKGVVETIQAFQLLLNKNISASLTIAGDGDILQELKNETRKMGLTSRQVHFTGDIRGEDKIKAFTDHHIYCFPSYSEGLPTSVLEAMAFGMPVVTSPVGGLVDIFQNGKMGEFVFSRSPEEIASKLEKLIMHKKMVAEIGLYNAAYAKKHFMASVVSGRLLSIYDSVLGSF